MLLDIQGQRFSLCCMGFEDQTTKRLTVAADHEGTGVLGVKVHQDEVEMRDRKTPALKPVSSQTICLPFSVILKHSFQQRKMIFFCHVTQRSVFSAVTKSHWYTFFFSSLIHEWFLSSKPPSLISVSLLTLPLSQCTCIPQLSYLRVGLFSF